MKVELKPCQKTLNYISFIYIVVLISSIVTSQWRAMILSFATTSGRYTANRLDHKEKKHPINHEFSAKDFQLNLPQEDSSCTLLKHVRVQGFKGL